MKTAKYFIDEYKKLYTLLNNSIREHLKDKKEVIFMQSSDDNVDEECYIESVHYDNGGTYNAYILGVKIDEKDRLWFRAWDYENDTEDWVDYVGDDCKIWILGQLEKTERKWYNLNTIYSLY